MPTSDYQRALDFLLGRIDYERVQHMPYRSFELKLARMQRLLDLIGNPEKKLKCIHVAGTKGKGSTSTMLDAILRRQGYRVGLFTSPHLHRVEERFCVDGRICSNEEFVDLMETVREAVELMDGEPQNKTTYFEITTALAMLFFVRQEVDISIFEVGLGGRLDSTNVCNPLVSLITSISFDHTRQLGNTLAKIAFEKAGIVKTGIPIVSGVPSGEARDVIRSVVAERNTEIFELSHHFTFVIPDRSKNRFHYRSLCDRFSDIENVDLNLLGRHQITNASLAITACQLVGTKNSPVTDKAIRGGLQNVVCHLRIEQVSDQPITILDAAHNVASTEALLDVIVPRMTDQNRVLVFATTVEKDFVGMLQRLLPHFDHVILTKYQNNPRGVAPSKLLKTCVAHQADLSSTTFRLTDSPKPAWDHARQLAGSTGFICVTGSFFIATEIRELMDAN